MRLLFVSVVLLGLFAACSDDDDVIPGETADAGDTINRDASTTRPDASSTPDAAPDATADASAAASCPAASATLASTGETSAPVLDAAASMLQRVASNDAFCTTQHNGAHPTFGTFGYILNIALTDADGDGPDLSALTTQIDVVRFGSSPEIHVESRFDNDHGWTTGGSGQQETLGLQLCLDEDYAAKALVIAVDVADQAGHRSAAICIEQQSGD